MSSQWNREIAVGYTVVENGLYKNGIQQYVIVSCDIYPVFLQLICSVKHPTAMQKEINTEVCTAFMIEKYLMMMIR